METVLAKHQEIQEKIAKDMIALTRSLKDHSMAARDIIKSDSQVSLHRYLYQFILEVEIVSKLIPNLYVVNVHIAYHNYTYMYTETSQYVP